MKNIFDDFDLDIQKIGKVGDYNTLAFSTPCGSLGGCELESNDDCGEHGSNHCWRTLFTMCYC